MIRVFGKAKAKTKSPPPEPTTAAAVRKVDDRADALEGQVNSLEAELKKYKDQLNRMREGPAKENVKQKAIRVLKQKRTYETQLENVRNQSFNIEQANFATQTAKDTKATVFAMRKGVKAMKKEIRMVNLNLIEHLQDEMADLLELHEEVQETVGRCYRMPEVDEDELRAELEALGDELALDSDNSYLDVIREEINTPGVLRKDPNSNKPRDNDPRGNSRSGNSPSGNSPSGNSPSGNCPSGNSPSGNRPSGNTPGVATYNSSDSSSLQSDYALVDEFGLPKLPAS